MSEKPHVRHIGGGWPWVARVNPGSGMFTLARRFPTWQEAMDWLCSCLASRKPTDSRSGE